MLKNQKLRYALKLLYLPNNTFYGKEFEIVSSLKYLGLVLESNGSLKSAISTLINQARSFYIGPMTPSQ